MKGDDEKKEDEKDDEKADGEKAEEKDEEKEEGPLVIEKDMMLEGKFDCPKKGLWWYEVKILEVKKHDEGDDTYLVQWQYDPTLEEELKADMLRKPGTGNGKDGGKAPEKKKE